MAQVSFKQAHHFTISLSNLGEVGGDFITSGSELTTRVWRPSKGKSQKPQKPPSPPRSLSIRPLPIVPSCVEFSDSHFADHRGNGAEISESELSLSTTLHGPHQPNFFECRTQRSEGSRRIRSSVQTWPSPAESSQNLSPPSIYYSSYSLSDDDLSRRRGHSHPSARHPLPPSISVDPPLHYPPRPQSIQAQASYIDSSPQVITPPPPVYPNRAIELNAMPAEGERETGPSPHPMPPQDILPSNSVDISGYQDGLGRHNRRPLRRRSRFYGTHGVTNPTADL